MPWFHGHITRDEAEKLLNSANPSTPDGLFLVRESTNFPGDFTLCVVFQQKVEHYRIIMQDGKLTIDEEEYFDTLSKLIEVRTVPDLFRTKSRTDEICLFSTTNWTRMDCARS